MTKFFIVLEIRKDTSSKVDYKLWVYALQKFEFKFLSKEEKYYGYFTFKNHMVLIISDNSADFFFTKLNIQTAFKFLSYTPRDEKDPPVSIEPLSYFHEYKNGQFN